MYSPSVVKVSREGMKQVKYQSFSYNLKCRKELINIQLNSNNG